MSDLPELSSKEAWTLGLVAVAFVFGFVGLALIVFFLIDLFLNWFWHDVVCEAVVCK